MIKILNEYLTVLYNYYIKITPYIKCNMNIFVSICGQDDRFMDFDDPKPFVNILGKQMIDWVIDNVSTKPNEIVYIIHDSSHALYLSERARTFKNIKYLPISRQTHGPVETYSIAIQDRGIDKSLPCAIIDCDTFFKADVLHDFRKTYENVVYCFEDMDDEPIYSYVSVSDDNCIRKTREKRKISNYACAGCYCFSNTNKFYDACKFVLDNRTTWYVSSVINEIIKTDTVKMKLLKSNEFHCLGTPNLINIFSSSETHIKSRFCFTLSVIINSPKHINYLKFLNAHGHTIIIETNARPEIDGHRIYELLREKKIPFDEVYMNRPVADFFINNNQQFNKIEKNTGFYNTKIKERSFNSIEESNIDVIVKHSDNEALRGEMHWYQNIPNDIKPLFPRYFSSNSSSYTIEKIKNISMSYLYVNNLLTTDLFDKIIRNINEIHDSRHVDADDINIYANYCNKLEKRYNDYDYSKFPGSSAMYSKLYNWLKQYEKNHDGCAGVIHGDPVFTNILLNSKDNIKFIDMRGMLGNQLSIYGDRWYDYAKIYQSLSGYDHILSGETLNNHDIKHHFDEYIATEYGSYILNCVRMIAKSLIFSLIPLHDKYQMEFYELISHI